MIHNRARHHAQEGLSVRVGEVIKVYMRRVLVKTTMANNRPVQCGDNMPRTKDCRTCGSNECPQRRGVVHVTSERKHIHMSHRQCGETCKAGFKCTRKKKHDGPHETSEGRVRGGERVRAIW